MHPYGCSGRSVSEEEGTGTCRSLKERSTLKTVNTGDSIKVRERSRMPEHPEGVMPEGRITFKHESLILAQDERWRRA